MFRYRADGNMRVEEIIYLWTYCASPQTGRACSESPSLRWELEGPEDEGVLKMSPASVSRYDSDLQ